MLLHHLARGACRQQVHAGRARGHRHLLDPLQAAQPVPADIASTSFRKSQVSRLAADLDEELEAWRQRRPDGRAVRRQERFRA